MSGGAGRPTHAAVPADIDPATLIDLTPGKTYRIVSWIDDRKFFIRDDIADMSMCFAKRCNRLRCHDWLLTTEPSAEDDTARKLANHDALLDALRALEEWVTNDSDGDTQPKRHRGRLALMAARKAIASAEGSK